MRFGREDFQERQPIIAADALFDEIFHDNPSDVITQNKQLIIAQMRIKS